MNISGVTRKINEKVLIISLYFKSELKRYLVISSVVGCTVNSRIDACYLSLEGYIDAFAYVKNKLKPSALCLSLFISLSLSLSFAIL